MPDIDMPEDDWGDYESGPFCRHWGDPIDCERVCASCGHRCPQHSFGHPTKCFVSVTAKNG